MPERPDEIPSNVKMDDRSGDVLIVVTKGVMTCGVYGSNPMLFPENKLKEAGDKLPITIPRVVGRIKKGIINNGYKPVKMVMENTNL